MAKNPWVSLEEMLPDFLLAGLFDPVLADIFRRKCVELVEQLAERLQLPFLVGQREDILRQVRFLRYLLEESGAFVASEDRP